MTDKALEKRFFEQTHSY